MVKWQRAVTLTFAVLLLSVLLPAGGLARVGTEAPPVQVDGRVESQVLAQLDAQGTAGYLVYLDERPDLSPAYQMDWIDRGRFVVEALQEAAARSQAPVRAYLDAQGAHYQAFWVENVIAVDTSGRATLEGLLSFSGVQAIRARRQLILYEPAAGDPQDIVPMGIEPNLTHVDADQVWAMGYTGQDVVVANIDTGVRYTHQALWPHFRGNDGNYDYDWWDPYGDHPTAPADDNGHGSHTMGIMVGDDAAHTNQIGMAPGAQWIACRGCNSNSCYDAELLECAQFVTAPWDLDGENPDPDLRPNVVNNSWGDCGRSYDGWFQQTVDTWQAAGIYPVFSNGNASNCSYSTPPGCNTVGNPARYGNVTGVGSTGQNDGQYATHSNWGPTDDPDTVNPAGYPTLKPQVLAPGVSIRSSYNSSDTAYAFLMGTSMSAPAVSGLVALMWSACPSLVGDYTTTENIIQNTATPIAYASNCGGEGPGNVPNMAAGWGEIDALAAVQGAIAQCSGLGHLQGTVTGDTPPAAIDEVQVTAIRQAGGTWHETTDASGYYTMTLPSGTFTVTVEHPQYATATRTGVAVDIGAVTTEDFHLDPKGLLQGYVLDANSGAPLPATLLASDGTAVDTDPATGHYEMLLDAGTYDVTAGATSYVSQTVSIGVTSGGTTLQDFMLLADVAVVPEPISLNVDLDDEGSIGAVMTNNLAIEYPFQFAEWSEPPARSQSWLTSGPDPFGYTYSDSNEGGGVQYGWIDATDGTALALTDDGEVNVALPFEFAFYGMPYNALRVGNNGAVLFGTTFGQVWSENQVLVTSSTDNLIAPFWDDIDDAAGDVYYKTVGTAPDRRFVVEWYNRPHYAFNGPVGDATFELILYESTHNLKFQYQDVTFGDAAYDDGASATVGIRATGTNYLQVSYNAPALADVMAICFRYPGSLPCDAGDVPWFGTGIEDGTILPGDSIVWTNYFTATAAAGIDQPGEYHASLLVVPDPAAGGLPIKEVPVIMTVLPTATMGKLEGLVTSDRPGGPLVAEIQIEGQGGISYTVTSDPLSGSYLRWLEMGTYTVTASAENYLSASVQVEIDSVATAVRNFELVLDAPQVAVAPLTFDFQVEPGSQVSESLSIANEGVADLSWEIRETTATTASLTAASATYAPEDPASTPDLGAAAGQIQGTVAWSDVPWIAEVPAAGVIPAGDGVSVDVVVDAGGLAAGGCYTATLGLFHDDPVQETPVLIPVHLCVSPVYRYGFLPLIARDVAP